MRVAYVMALHRLVWNNWRVIFVEPVDFIHAQAHLVGVQTHSGGRCVGLCHR